MPRTRSETKTKRKTDPTPKPTARPAFMPSPLQIVREHERRYLTSLSRISWWRLERKGLVPKRVTLGCNASGWLRGELEAWITQRAAARR